MHRSMIVAPATAHARDATFVRASLKAKLNADASRPPTLCGMELRGDFLFQRIHDKKLNKKLICINRSVGRFEFHCETKLWKKINGHWK